MKHESNDVKALTALAISFLSSCSGQPLEGDVMRILVPMLVNGTKEKNTLVKTNSEQALVVLLKIRKGDQTLQVCNNRMSHFMYKQVARSLSGMSPKEDWLAPAQITYYFL